MAVPQRRVEIVLSDDGIERRYVLENADVKMERARTDEVATFGDDFRRYLTSGVRITIEAPSMTEEQPRRRVERGDYMDRERDMFYAGNAESFRRGRPVNTGQLRSSEPAKREPAPSAILNLEETGRKIIL